MYKIMVHITMQIFENRPAPTWFLSFLQLALSVSSVYVWQPGFYLLSRSMVSIWQSAATPRATQCSPGSLICHHRAINLLFWLKQKSPGWKPNVKDEVGRVADCVNLQTSLFSFKPILIINPISRWFVSEFSDKYKVRVHCLVSWWTLN